MAKKIQKIDNLCALCQTLLDNYSDAELVRTTVGALTDAQLLLNPSEINGLYDSLGKTTDDLGDMTDIVHDINALMDESGQRFSGIDQDDLENDLKELCMEEVRVVVTTANGTTATDANRGVAEARAEARSDKVREFVTRKQVAAIFFVCCLTRPKHVIFLHRKH